MQQNKCILNVNPALRGLIKIRFKFDLIPRNFSPINSRYLVSRYKIDFYHSGLQRVKKMKDYICLKNTAYSLNYQITQEFCWHAAAYL